MTERAVSIWVRGVFELTDGRRLTRTVRREVILQPDDATDERLKLAFAELIEELQAAGSDFAEGHGVLVDILGMAHG